MRLTPTKKVRALAQRYAEMTLTLHSTAVFLERLQSYSPLPPAHLQHIGNLYSFNATTNAELRYRFYELALLDPLTPEAHSLAREAANWVVGNDGTGIVKGRMKFCRPVLRAANRANPSVTKDIFTMHKASFHPIAKRLIEKVHELSIFAISWTESFIYRT